MTLAVTVNQKRKTRTPKQRDQTRQVMWSIVNIKTLITANFTLRYREEKCYKYFFIQRFLTSENSDGLCKRGKRRPWGWSTSNKTERETTSASPRSSASTFSPSCSSHWMPPHWSPLRPWMPAGVPLTFNLWPPAPQNSSQSRQLSGLSGEHILWSTVTATEGSDSSEHRC